MKVRGRFHPAQQQHFEHREFLLEFLKMCQKLDKAMRNHERSHDPAAIPRVGLLLSSATVWSELGMDLTLYTFAGIPTNKNNRLRQK